MPEAGQDAVHVVAGEPFPVRAEQERPGGPPGDVVRQHVRDGGRQRQDAVLVLLPGHVHVDAAGAADDIGDVRLAHLGDAAGEGVEQLEDEAVELGLGDVAQCLNVCDLQDRGRGRGVALVDLGPVVLGDGVAREVHALGGVLVQRRQHVQAPGDRRGGSALCLLVHAPRPDVVGGEAAQGEPLLSERAGVRGPRGADVVQVVPFGVDAAPPGGGEPVQGQRPRLGGDVLGEEFEARHAGEGAIRPADPDRSEVGVQFPADRGGEVVGGQFQGRAAGTGGHGRGSDHTSEATA